VRETITTILFDWDGTLNDTAASGFEAFQKSFQQLGLHFDQEFYDAHYSPNWYAMYEALQLPRELWQRADDLWIYHYGTEPSRLVEGAHRTILELARRGFRLGIVSSGSHNRVTQEIAEHRLEAVFQAVVCNEQIVEKKPHPEGLIQAMRLMKVEPGACAYVGDAPEDIEMGKEACVFTVGVRGSYPSSKRLSLARPHLHLEAIDELLPYFSEG
jgi:HAD superfamily hydrolase (TIGR01549 family)